MAQIIKRSLKNGDTSYLVRIRLKGTEESKSFRRLSDAKQWIQKRELEIHQGKSLGFIPGKTVEDLVYRYIKEVLPEKKGAANYIRAFNLFSQHLGSMKLVDLAPFHLNRLREALAKECEISVSTVNRYMGYIRRSLQVAFKEWNWIASNPAADIARFKEPKGRVRYLSESELKRLLNECKKSKTCLYKVVMLALGTGARKNEILSLRWKNLNFIEKHIVFEDTKNGETRTVPMSAEIKSMLEDSKGEDGMFVFPGSGKNPFDIRRAWTKAIRDAEIKNFKFHDLRHTAASYMVMSGVSLILLAEILGHKSMEMVKRYAHFDTRHKQDAINELSQKIFI